MEDIEKRGLMTNTPIIPQGGNSGSGNSGSSGGTNNGNGGNSSGSNTAK